MSRARGVLGGAFNPPHIGHLLLAQEAVATLGLDEVLLVPTGQAPHKSIDPEPGSMVRLELTRVAAEGAPGLEVSSIEVDREGPSFSYRTLELLADEDPGIELTLVMGADVAAGKTIDQIAADINVATFVNVARAVVPDAQRHDEAAAARRRVASDRRPAAG